MASGIHEFPGLGMDQVPWPLVSCCLQVALAMTRHIRTLEKQFPGIQISRTRGGHLVATVGTSRIYMAATPSDARALANIRASIRRAERGLRP